MYKSNRAPGNEKENSRPRSCLAERPRYSRSPSPVPTHQISIKVRDDERNHNEYIEHVYVNINSRKEMDHFLRFCDERIEKVMNVKPKFELNFPDPTSTQTINENYYENLDKKPDLNEKEDRLNS